MKLEFEPRKANTSGVQFRIDPDTKKMMNALKRFYNVGTGELIKQMIKQSYASLSELISDMEEFVYNKSDTFESNFNTWQHMNRKEREIYKDIPLSTDEAYARFCSLYPEYAPNRLVKGLRSYLPI